MIRFPNPGSDIPSFIRIFQTLYTYLCDAGPFSLDDMSVTLTRMNLAASSGHVGERALALSTRDDRSRDPLYNQSKMYAELFRTLGWMCSSSKDRALLFRFTLLGDHVAVADVDPRAIFEESVIGINYPNRILDIKGTEASRVFSAILRTAHRLDGYTCRDEIILGALNMNDVDDEAIDNIVNEIRRLRGSNARLQEAINTMSGRTGIQVNTLQNYTRFPLAVLTYCGWFDKERTSQFYPGSHNMVMLRMTPYGRERAEGLEQAIDIRLGQYESQEPERQTALIRVGFYTMLQRANFDITPAIAQIASDRERLHDAIVPERDVIFSPYQTVRPETADYALGITPEVQPVREKADEYIVRRALDTQSNARQTTDIRLRPITTREAWLTMGNVIGNNITHLIREGLSDNVIATHLFKHYGLATKEVFYPLVADLFTNIGFNCHASRAGINYERWDAIAVDERYSVPIEIKSPMEELFISIKAVRQALENKVILLSRKSYTTDWNTATLAVGYNPPNDRAEVSRLISDIKNTFDVNVGVIDFLSLLRVAIAAIRGGSRYVEEIRNMEGLINVESI